MLACANSTCSRACRSSVVFGSSERPISRAQLFEAVDALAGRVVDLLRHGLLAGVRALDALDLLRIESIATGREHFVLLAVARRRAALAAQQALDRREVFRQGLPDGRVGQQRCDIAHPRQLVQRAVQVLQLLQLLLRLDQLLDLLGDR